MPRTTSSIVCDHTFSALVVVLSIVYLCFQGIRKRWDAFLAFVIIYALCWLVQVVSMGAHVLDWRVCLLLALVGSNVVALPHTVQTQRADASHGVGDEAVEGFAATTDTGSKGARARSGRKSRRGASVVAADTPAKASDGTVRTDGGYVDTFSTFMETYKTLTPPQIERMTNDTKELIQTQKSLMDTVKSFAPVLSEGRQMMNTFKEFMGEGAGADGPLSALVGGKKKDDNKDD